MQIVDVRTKSEDELKQLAVDLTKEAFNLRFQKTSGQLENLVRPRQIRKELARIKTVLRERDLGLNFAAVAKKTGKTTKTAAVKKTAKKKVS